MVLKYIFGVFVLLGEDGFRFIVLLRDVSCGRVTLLYLSCILPRYSPRIHKTSPPLCPGVFWLVAKVFFRASAGWLAQQTAFYITVFFLNQNAQQAPLNAQESLSLNPEKSTCTQMDLKKSYQLFNKVVEISVTMMFCVHIQYRVLKFIPGPFPVSIGINRQLFKVSEVLGGHFFQGGAIARRPPPIFLVLLALRISQDMHYYKDGAVRVKRQMLDPGFDSAGWMFKGVYLEDYRR